MSCSTQSADLKNILSFIHPICFEDLYYILGTVLRIKDKDKDSALHKQRECKILSDGDKCYDINPSWGGGGEC